MNKKTHTSRNQHKLSRKRDLNRQLLITSGKVLKFKGLKERNINWSSLPINEEEFLSTTIFLKGKKIIYSQFKEIKVIINIKCISTPNL